MAPAREEDGSSSNTTTMPLKLRRINKALKGLASNFQPFASPESSIENMSNVLYLRRNAVTTCDGSLAQYSPNLGGTNITGFGTIMSLNTPVALQNAPSLSLAAPSGLVSASVGGGTWAAGTYTFKITAIDKGGNETTPSALTSITLPDNVHGIQLSWSAVTFAAGYYVYLLSGTYQRLSTTPIPVTVLTNTMLAQPAFVSPTANPPVANNTPQMVLRALAGTTFPPAPPSTYDDTVGVYLVDTFPASPQLTAAGLVLADAYGSVNGSSPTGTPLVTSPIPQIITDSNSYILALGKSFPPYTWDGIPAHKPIALANTYAASFPTWVASATYPVGSVVVPSPTNGFFYKSIQAGTGVSGVGQPAFPTTVGARVNDNTLIWQNVGSTAVPAPRGAAHAIYHGGFLYLYNTSTNQTTDALDGPNVLKQSDLNNHNSWNPQNTIFIGSSNASGGVGAGGEGMGMAVFTVAEAGIAPSEQLMLFTNYGVYIMTGFMPNQVVNAIKTNKGCVAPRTIQFIAELQAIIRLSHEGPALCDGISDQLVIGDDVKPFFFPDPNVSNITALDQQFLAFCQSTLTQNPAMYVMAGPIPGNQGKLSRLLCLDIIQKTWAVIDLPFFIYAMAQTAVPRPYSPALQTQLGGYSDGIVRRWQSGDVTWDTGAQVAWSAQSDSMFGDDPTNRVYVRSIMIRGLGLSSPLTFQALVQTNDLNLPQSSPLVYQFASGSVELEVPVDSTVLDASVVLSGTGRVEIDTIAWQTGEDKPAVGQWSCP